MFARAMVGMLVLCAAGCSGGGGSSSAAAPKGETLSVAECRQVMEKSMQLQGMPAETFAQIADQAAQECHASGKATKEHLRCAMAATSMEQLQACQVPVGT